jgi:hypothetical protein
MKSNFDKVLGIAPASRSDGGASLPCLFETTQTEQWQKQWIANQKAGGARLHEGSLPCPSP